MLENLAISDLNELRLDKTQFESTSPELNAYFHRYAGQDSKKSLSKCYVMHNENAIISYYTLSAHAISVAALPEKVQGKVGYSTLPAAMLGRLAVDKRFTGNGFGAVLVFDAIHRLAQSVMGVSLLVVEAKNAQAEAFYQRLGFYALDDGIAELGERKAYFYPISKIFNAMQR